MAAHCRNEMEIKNNFYCSLVRMVSAHSEGVQQGVESITYQQPNRHHIFLSSLQNKIASKYKMHRIRTRYRQISHARISWECVLHTRTCRNPTCPDLLVSQLFRKRIVCVYCRKTQMNGCMPWVSGEDSSYIYIFLCRRDRENDTETIASNMILYGHF